MKNLLLAFALLFAAPSFAQIHSARLKADGLTCSMCSKSIFKALEKVPFIESIDADVETSVFTLKFKSGAAISPDRLKKAVTDAGFTVGRLELMGTLPENAPSGKDAHISFDGATWHLLNADKPLSGEQTLLIVDKGFMPNATRAPYRKLTQMSCFETGKMEKCCSSKDKEATRVYHVSL